MALEWGWGVVLEASSLPYGACIAPPSLPPCPRLPVLLMLKDCALPPALYLALSLPPPPPACQGNMDFAFLFELQHGGSV